MLLLLALAYAVLVVSIIAASSVTPVNEFVWESSHGELMNGWSPPKRPDISIVHLCTGTNWTGLCAYAVHELGDCTVLEPPFERNIGSFSPNPCSLCFAYETHRCQFGRGIFWMFVAPGNATGGVGVPNSVWQHRIRSFNCWRSPDCEPSGISFSAEMVNPDDDYGQK